MLFVNPLDSILGQLSKVKILRFLCKTQAEFNGREISKITKLSHVKCHTALKSFASHGLLIYRNVGRSTLYKVNTDNFLIKNILQPLFSKEADLLEYLIIDIVKIFKELKPTSIIVYGSTIREDARADSDVDLLIIFKDDANPYLIKKYIEQVSELLSPKYGNQLSCKAIKESSFKQKIKNENNLYSEIIRTGKLVYGKTISELL